jgi:hypothetical protein
MAKRMLDQGASHPVPFEINIDSGYIVGGHEEKHETALTINPDASLEVLLAAVERRVGCLHQSLDAWARAGQGDVYASEVAGFLEPAMNEIVVLLGAARKRMWAGRAVIAEASHG